MLQVQVQPVQGDLALQEKNKMDNGFDLFAAAAEQEAKTSQGRYEPLAQRMRPRNFDEFIGKLHKCTVTDKFDIYKVIKV